MAARKPGQLEDRFTTKEMAEGTYSAQLVNQFHRNSDVDSSKTAQHHTIGPGPNQVASGVHNHDGTESRSLLEGVSLTGAKGGNAALASVIAALVQLGAEDNTTA